MPADGGKRSVRFLALIANCSPLFSRQGVRFGRARSGGKRKAASNRQQRVMSVYSGVNRTIRAVIADNNQVGILNTISAHDHLSGLQMSCSF